MGEQRNRLTIQFYERKYMYFNKTLRKDTLLWG